jgi:hypothetical protein
MRRVVVTFAVAAGAVVTLAAAELKPHTLASWERYIALHDALLAQNRASDDIPFLWIDRQPTADRAGLYARLNSGEVVVERFELREEGEKVDVDDGKIHHWYGAVFIPGATIDDVLAWVQDYEDYPVRFTPLIDSAEVLSQEDERWTVRMRNRMKKVITIVMDVDYVIDYQRLSPTQLETMNVATNIFQVHDAGEPDERREPGDEAGGYLWRFRMVCRFDQRDQGTFEECENLSLTRSVPILLRWLVNPFVSSVPRETIEFNMGAVRDGVGKTPGG